MKWYTQIKSSFSVAWCMLYHTGVVKCLEGEVSLCRIFVADVESFTEKDVDARPHLHFFPTGRVSHRACV